MFASLVQLGHRAGVGMFAGLAQLGHRAGVGPADMFAGLAQLGQTCSPRSSATARRPADDSEAELATSAVNGCCSARGERRQ